MGLGVVALDDRDEGLALGSHDFGHGCCCAVGGLDEVDELLPVLGGLRCIVTSATAAVLGFGGLRHEEMLLGNSEVRGCTTQTDRLMIVLRGVEEGNLGAGYAKISTQPANQSGSSGRNSTRPFQFLHPGRVAMFNIRGIR